MNRTANAVLLSAIVFFAAGFAAAWEEFAHGHPIANHPRRGAHAPAKATKSGRKILYWASPMDPSKHSDHFKRDHMHMAYVPVYAPSQGSTHEAGLSVDPRMIQSLGVHLTTATMRVLGREINTFGTIHVDQNRRFDVSPRTSGWLTNLKVRAIGQEVKKGELLAEIYSPAIFAAENEYAVILKEQGQPGGKEMTAAARQRLALLGVGRREIKALTAGRVPRDVMNVRAPANGTVLALGAHEGGYVHAGQRLFKLADLSTVWADVSLSSNQLPWVRVGNPVTLSLASDPESRFQGRVVFLYPTLDPSNRTVAARVALANPQGMLRPGAFVNAMVLGQPRRALAVPADAVLRTQNADYVMRATGGGHFLPTQVHLGPEAHGWQEVSSGLKPGDRIAESAQFLLFAESQMQQVKARMLGPAATTTETPERPQ
ncbi:MAG: efflux RND transporter periplasmic adaptor subunit [Acidiferrobacteraceae bacterium]